MSKVIALDAEDVRITTCTVTIKTLRVDSRQLTQSVFRQLPEIDLIDPVTLELSGLPWGWVNYHLGHHRHQNFVIQKGQHLYRSEFWVAEFLEIKKECIEWEVYRTTMPRPPSSIRKFIREGGFLKYNILGPYSERWNELMGRLRSIEQLYIAA